jgi:hypothetical protein
VIRIQNRERERDYDTSQLADGQFLKGLDQFDVVDFFGEIGEKINEDEQIFTDLIIWSNIITKSYAIMRQKELEKNLET